MKFIVITGGVVSGLGKGITASSIALLLKSCGKSVSAIKIDPYLNIDAGTMSPYEHGECYVLADGGESDLDLGNYERFLGIQLTKDHNITTGKIYQQVLQRERRGDYLGKTVQIIPHVTNEIQEWIDRVSKVPVDGPDQIPDFCMIEVGGTIGDMETAPFLEAIRQMSMKPEHTFCFVHVSLLIENGGEIKTKPTQQSMATLRSLGISPNLLILRAPVDGVNSDILAKLSIQCHIPKENILVNSNVPNIYYVPRRFYEQDILPKLHAILHMTYDPSTIDLCDYMAYLSYFDKCQRSELPKIVIVIAGKYMNTPDTYLSVIRAIEHAAFSCKVATEIRWFDTENDTIEKLVEIAPNAVIIPGGFGARGISGKLAVAKWCRETKVPILGICLGMQIMVCEILKANGVDADSVEWNPETSNPAIHMLPDQTSVYGGTMRLGNYRAKVLSKWTNTYKYYGEEEIVERHRHRYEVNNVYRNHITGFGLQVSAESPDIGVVEMVELRGHPFYVGCQFHPEYASKNTMPHPLFIGLIDTAYLRLLKNVS
jgi:CTP synthase